MPKWAILVSGKDGMSCIVNLVVKGWTYGYIDLQDPHSFDFGMYQKKLIPSLEEQRLTIFLQSFILLQGLPLQPFQNQFSGRVSLNVIPVMGVED